MNLFKLTAVKGIGDCLEERGLIRWPNEKTANAIYLDVARSLNGPEILPASGLSKESALQIGRFLKSASDELAQKGYVPSASEVLRVKQASSRSFEERVAINAELCMKLAAEEASLTSVGANTPESAAATDQHAALDQRNRATNQYHLGVGKTQMPSGGVVGQQMVAPNAQQGPSISNSLTALDKQADEDMAAADLTPGATPGALQRAMMFLAAMKNKVPGFRPGPEAQVAAGGLGQTGAPGMEVMAAVIESPNIKTAEDADAIIQQILEHQGQAGELASPELIAAIEQLLAQGQGGQDADEGQMPPGMPQGMPEQKEASMSERLAKGRAAVENMAGKHPTAAKGVAAAGATLAAAGAKKLHDYISKKKEPESKSASLLAQLKAATETNSLTSVGKNTPEAAASTEQTAKLDQENRSTNEYLIGQGGASKLPNKGQILAVEAAPKHDAVATNTTPSRETKSAEEVEYLAAFKKVASELGPHLPSTLSQEVKVAHIKTLMGLPPSERLGYIQNLLTK